MRDQSCRVGKTRMRRDKASRGKFTAAFMLQCLEAVDAQKLELV